MNIKHDCVTSNAVVAKWQWSFWWHHSIPNLLINLHIGTIQICRFKEKYNLSWNIPWLHVHIYRFNFILIGYCLIFLDFCNMYHSFSVWMGMHIYFACIVFFFVTSGPSASIFRITAHAFSFLFPGHYLDQKRLKQGLYRHPWDDISYVMPEHYAS